LRSSALWGGLSGAAKRLTGSSRLVQAAAAAGGAGRGGGSGACDQSKHQERGCCSSSRGPRHRCCWVWRVPTRVARRSEWGVCETRRGLLCVRRGDEKG
jgi:hypothetical protein